MLKRVNLCESTSDMSLNDENVPPISESVIDECACENINIKGMYTNTDCLPNKIEELEMFLHSEKIDIAAINETNPKKSPPGEVLNFDIIPGYKCVYNSSGRGVCLYIKNSIQFTRCLEIESLFSPSVFCKLSLSNKKSVLVGSI